MELFSRHRNLFLATGLSISAVVLATSGLNSTAQTLDDTASKEREALTPAELSNDPYMSRSPYSVNTGTKGAASVYPDTASNLYLNNIEAAEAGDADAQYWVGRAFELCRLVGSEEELASIAHSNRFDDEFISRISADFASCEELKRKVSEEIINDQSTAEEWYLKAYDGGSELAKGWHVYFAPNEHTSETAASAVKAAVKAGDPSSTRFMQMFHAKPDGSEEMQAWSWVLTTCSQDDRCDNLMLVEQLQYRFKPYEFEELSDLSAQNASRMYQSTEGEQ